MVIPAKAGSRLFYRVFPIGFGVDSRFRGNDDTWEHFYFANDTTTQIHVFLPQP
jgi:hypothetical protein